MNTNTYTPLSVWQKFSFFLLIKKTDKQSDGHGGIIIIFFLCCKIHIWIIFDYFMCVILLRAEYNFWWMNNDNTSMDDLPQKPTAFIYFLHFFFHRRILLCYVRKISIDLLLFIHNANIFRIVLCVSLSLSSLSHSFYVFSCILGSSTSKLNRT